MEIYDETVAVKKINEALSKAARSEYDADELLNVIDMIWDFYEENGLLEIDDDFVPDEDENIAEELADYVSRMLRKDKSSKIQFEDIPLIIKAELEYEDSVLDIFCDEEE